MRAQTDEKLEERESLITFRYERDNNLADPERLAQLEAVRQLKHFNCQQIDLRLGQLDALEDFRREMEVEEDAQEVGLGVEGRERIMLLRRENDERMEALEAWICEKENE